VRVDRLQPAEVGRVYVSTREDKTAAAELAQRLEPWERRLDPRGPTRDAATGQMRTLGLHTQESLRWWCERLRDGRVTAEELRKWRQAMEVVEADKGALIGAEARAVSITQDVFTRLSSQWEVIMKAVRNVSVEAVTADVLRKEAARKDTLDANRAKRWKRAVDESRRES